MLQNYDRRFLLKIPIWVFFTEGVSNFDTSACLPFSPSVINRMKRWLNLKMRFSEPYEWFISKHRKCQWFRRCFSKKKYFSLKSGGCCYSIATIAVILCKK
jgi:hypothetical protein